jgi:hypothetical protein
MAERHDSYRHGLHEGDEVVPKDWDVSQPARILTIEGNHAWVRFRSGHQSRLLVTELEPTVKEPYWWPKEEAEEVAQDRKERKKPDQDLLDAASCRVPVERIRELWKVRTNTLAVRYLTTENENDRADALDGLVFCSDKAVKYLGFAIDDDQGLASGRGVRLKPDPHSVLKIRNVAAAQERLIFVWETVLEILKPYQGASRRSLLLAALEGKFRYIPRLVKLRALDRIRHETRERVHLWYDLDIDPYSKGTRIVEDSEGNMVKFEHWGLDSEEEWRLYANPARNPARPAVKPKDN